MKAPESGVWVTWSWKYEREERGEGEKISWDAVKVEGRSMADEFLPTCRTSLSILSVESLL